MCCDKQSVTCKIMNFQPIYKLSEWIPENKLIIPMLCKNKSPGVVNLLKKEEPETYLSYIRSNPNILLLMEDEENLKHWYYWENPSITTHLYKQIYNETIKIMEESDLFKDTSVRHFIDLFWMSVSKNSNAIMFIENHLEKIHWKLFSGNPHAIPLLEKHPNKLDWNTLSGNPNAIHLLEKRPERICWEALSANPNAIKLLEQNMDKIDWDALSENPNAFHLLWKNSQNVDLYRLARNPSVYAVEFLRDYIAEYTPKSANTFWSCLSQNPFIFTLDQEAMKRANQPFAEELAAMVFHPQRVQKIAEKHNLTLDEYLERI